MKEKHLQVLLSHDGKNRATNITGDKKHTSPHSRESQNVLKRPQSWEASFRDAAITVISVFSFCHSIILSLLIEIPEETASSLL